MGLRQPGQVPWDGGFVPHGGDERRGRVPGVAAGHEVSPGHGAGSGKLGELVANELREGGKAAGNGAWERHGETEVRINGLEGEEKKKYKERRDKKAKDLKKRGGGEGGGERKKRADKGALCALHTGTLRAQRCSSRDPPLPPGAAGAEHWGGAGAGGGRRGGEGGGGGAGGAVS